MGAGGSVGPLAQVKLAVSEALEAHGDTHAAADAERGEALLCVAPCHLEQQRVEDACARCPDRVTDGDRTAIDVDDFRVPAKVLVDAQAWAAKASLASTRSRSSIFQPARSSALREAGIGPVPMICGSTPAVAQETIRAIGVMPRRDASPSLISTAAAAPSLMPDALPAVTVPSLSKAGFSFCMPSSVRAGADITRP